ncbi:MAG: right-handed parallel beta-helix repeat-containing protein [Gelidibacter sp.]
MKHLILHITFLLLSLLVQAQKEFHVTTDGKSTGNGSLQNPWDLQTALSQKPDVVNGGDTIWLHEGIYNGRFISTIKSTTNNTFITVAPYQSAKVTLNGNVALGSGPVLTVKGKQVIFMDFEVTWLGIFSRDENDKDFRVGGGVNHTSGQDCRFYNLIIHDNPGLGFGSWKQTGGTIIENCLIYYNGHMSKDGQGRGEGIYVQNAGETMRIIRNNIIFANYYKGIEVWSASKRNDYSFVKNIALYGNLIFNSGLPSKRVKDNVIVASNDRNGRNIAQNIQILDNVLYHNTDVNAEKINGDSPSLTLGFHINAPVENVVVKNNIIISRDDALRLFYIKSLIFQDNTVFSKFLQINSSQLENSKSWNFKNNIYYTEKEQPFRVSTSKDYDKEIWDTEFKLDKNSQWKKTREFDIEPVLSIAQHSQKQNTFNVALLSKLGNDVEVDFSQYPISKGTSYKIYDVENRNEVLTSGIVDETKTIKVPMALTKLKMPLHNDRYLKTPSNFGVFIIEFESLKTSSTEELSGFSKFLKWLGF